MASTSAAPPDRTGQLLGARYRLEGVIGRGGQSVVYRARDERDGDRVAIKVLNDRVARESDWVERMFREAEAMARLSGTAAVRVLDQTWTDDGAMGLVMELLDGVDLEDQLVALEARGLALPAHDLVRLADPIALTLEAAHAEGIVHRDLKPSNIFLLRDGSVRLLDFGFAKFVRKRRLTALGTIPGSPSYIAPEAWKQSADKLDHRADVYGFGAVVFRALGGHPPFVAPHPLELMKLVTEAERPSLRALRPDLPAPIDDWVRQSLAIDPDQRFNRVRGQMAALRASLLS
jgi:serine/threonine-protein kinase